jgi:hypothetical protein
MADSVHGNNDASRRRLAAVVARLTEADLAKVIDGEWTVAAELGHLAFWDRIRAATWTEALAAGRDGPTPFPSDLSDLMNRVGIHDWTRIPGRLAAQGALEAAERIDSMIAGLPADTIAAMIASDRRSFVDRSRHRGEHLDTIVGAVPAR